MSRFLICAHSRNDLPSAFSSRARRRSGGVLLTSKGSIYETNFMLIELMTSARVAAVVVVVVEASAPKVYPRVTLASASTLPGLVVRTLRGGEGPPNMVCLVASSLGHLRSQCSIVCGSSLQRGHRGSAEGSRRLA